MSNRWQDDSNRDLASALRTLADLLASKPTRSETDIEVEALQEAAHRLNRVRMLERSIDSLKKRLREFEHLKRGRITTWHAQRVTAGQLRAYLEAAEWAKVNETNGPGEEWYCAKPMPGVEDAGAAYAFKCSSARHHGISFLLADDGHGYETLRYHYEAIEAIAAIEDRGELAVWTDLQQIDEEAT